MDITPCQEFILDFSEEEKFKISHAIPKVVRSYVGKADSQDRDDNEDLLTRFFNAVQKETKFKRRTYGSGGIKDNPFTYMMEAWAKGDSRRRPELAVAAYYWFHVHAKNKTFAKNLDHALWDGKTFEEHFKRKIPGKKYEDHDLAVQAKTPSPPSKAPTINNSPKLTAEQWLNPHNQDHLPFFGREKELQTLDDFVAHSDPFRIWAISGPSGAGKTRLCTKWMGESAALAGWDKRMLKADEKDAEYWKTWTPAEQTLIVIDYMFGFAGVIQQIISRCQDGLPHKVRLLVIDHIFPKDLRQLLDDPRWGVLEMSGAGFDTIKPLFFDQSPLDINETTDQDKIIRSIITYLAGSKANNTAIEDAEQYLKATPKAWHPLFAALVGGALREKKPYQSWNRRDLIYYYLEGSDRLPWKRGDAQGKWAACMIAAATARRGVAFSLLTDCIPENEEILAKGYAPVKDICKRIVSSGNDHELPPFEPDLLGESFFLLFLQSLNDSPKLFRQKFIEMLSTGDSDTQVKTALNFIGFIERLVRNLSNDNQDNDDVKVFWRTILEFMNPELFPSGSCIKRAVSTALIKISDIVEDHLPQEEYNQLLRQIDVEPFCEEKDESLLRAVMKCSMKYLERIYSINASSTLPESMLTFFRHYDKVMLLRFSLLDASSAGNLTTVKMLLAAGFDVNQKTKFGTTSLMAACEFGHEVVAKELVKAGADIHLEVYNNTAFTCAIESGNKSLVSLLIDSGANINNVSRLGHSPFERAILVGHTAIAQLLINAGANVNDESIPLVYMASLAGDTNMVKLLIDAGANINLAAHDGTTALQIACQSDYKNIERLLIEAGAK